MKRRGAPRPSTVLGTLRVLARGPSSSVPSELDRLLVYWPALHSRVLAQARSLPHPHFHEVLLWLLSQPAVELPGPAPASPAPTELDSSTDVVVLSDGYTVCDDA